MDSLCQTYERLGKYSDALTMAEGVYQARSQTYGKWHSDTIQAMVNLSWLYYQLERYQECIPLYKRILEFRFKEHGAHSLKAAVVLNNLAMSYNKLGNYAEALPLMQQAYDIRKDLLGEDDPKTRNAKKRLSEFHRHLHTPP